MADIEGPADYAIMFTPGRWEFRIDGVDAEENALSYVSPALDLDPGSMVLSPLTPYTPEPARPSAESTSANPGTL